MKAELVRFDADELRIQAAGIALADIAPLVNGEQPSCGPPTLMSSAQGWTVNWPILKGQGTSIALEVRHADTDAALTLQVVLQGIAEDVRLDSIGVRFGRAEGARRYLRNGYTSWDGSYFIEPANAPDWAEAGPAASLGYAMTALAGSLGGAIVLGFLRHDRYQSRFQFACERGRELTSLSIETLIDRVDCGSTVRSETLLVIGASEIEELLRAWARHVANASPLPPRLRSQRISGWCSWYSLYSSISEPLLLEHLQAAARFRDRYRVPFEVFQIDDGFVPEMGDWLDIKPQFPRGMARLLADIRATGFVPGLWIAPFMVGNRSRLYAAHPDWIVTACDTGKPLAPMKFYGEFRWHKRSEEYYILDITHPEAEAYIRNVFRVWARDWGCGYFKTDFMYFGSEYGPAQARWHQPGLSRMQIWMRMARLIREEIGDALWLACGGPIWAPVGLVDAVRIGRDIGVSWHGHYSAESLLRDQTTRNFANGLLWQADPDCILLRDRYHELTDPEVRSLARFAALTGGVLMTSDQLDEVPSERRALFAAFAADSANQPCDFPLLGQTRLSHRAGLGHTGQPTIVTEGDPVLIQRIRKPGGKLWVNVFNTGDTEVERLVPWELVGGLREVEALDGEGGAALVSTTRGIEVTIPAHASCLLSFAKPTP
jgi:alpha-galactosidase